MKHSLSWVAIKDTDGDEASDLFGLVRTGVHVGFLESEIIGRKLESGWYVIVFDKVGVDREVLKNIFQFKEIVSCEIEEHTLYSAVSFWSKGAEHWSVVCDFQKGYQHLERRGVLPAKFFELQDKLFATSDAEKKESVAKRYFEIPVELAESICSYRYDTEAVGEQVYQILLNRPVEVGKINKPFDMEQYVASIK